MIDEERRENVNELATILEENGWEIRELNIWNHRNVTIDVVKVE